MTERDKAISARADAPARSRIVDLQQLKLDLELGGYLCRMLGWGFLGSRWWRNYLHIHSYYEICYAFEGSGVFRIHDVEHAVGPGDMFVAKPAEPHEIISSREAPLGIYFWYYTLVPPVRSTRPSAGDVQTDALLSEFAASRNGVSSRTAGMQATLDLLTLEIVNRAPGFRIAVAGLVRKLLLDTARAVTDLSPSHQDDRADEAGSADGIAGQVIRYLEDNFDRPITLRDVAAQAHLSERHTSRLFHQLTGQSIMECLLGIRIKAAAQLLLSGQAPVKDVCAKCGFPDVQHFTTVFKRQAGLTPAAFRRRGGTRFLGDPNLTHTELT